MVSWNDTIACAINSDGGEISAISRDTLGPATKPLTRNSKTLKWSCRLDKSYQAKAIIPAGNAVAIAGGIYNLTDPLKAGGFIRIMSLETGKTISEIKFPSPITYNGLVAANGKFYATFEDGSAACLADGD